MISVDLPSSSSATYERAVCWDFDKTLVFAHWHNILKEAEIAHGDGHKYIEELMYGTPIGSSESVPSGPRGLRNPKEISQSMKRTLEKGVAVAIVSFTKYPEVIKAALMKLTEYADFGGLKPSDVDKIFIRGGFPSDDNVLNSPMGKKEHLLDVMRHFNISKKEDLLLVDDTIRNCLICRGINPGDCLAIDPDAVGFQAVDVPPYNNPSLEYIQQVNLFVAPITQDELDEKDFLSTLNFAKNRLRNLNFTMSRLIRLDDDHEDPVEQVVKKLKSIRTLPLPFAQRKEKIKEVLRQSKLANVDNDVSYMINIVEDELNDNKPSL